MVWFIVFHLPIATLNGIVGIQQIGMMRNQKSGTIREQTVGTDIQCGNLTSVGLRGLIRWEIERRAKPNDRSAAFELATEPYRTKSDEIGGSRKREQRSVKITAC